MFIDRAIHAPRRPFSHVLGSQEVGKSSFFSSRLCSSFSLALAPRFALLSFALFFASPSFFPRSLSSPAFRSSAAPFVLGRSLVLRGLIVHFADTGENEIYPRHASEDTIPASTFPAGGRSTRCHLGAPSRVKIPPMPSSSTRTGSSIGERRNRPVGPKRSTATTRCYSAHEGRSLYPASRDPGRKVFHLLGACFSPIDPLSSRVIIDPEP